MRYTLLPLLFATSLYAAEPMHDTTHRDWTEHAQKNEFRQSYHPRLNDKQYARFDVGFLDDLVERFDLERHLDLDRRDRNLARYERDLYLSPVIDPRGISPGVQFYIPDRGDRFSRSAMRIGAAAFDYLIRHETAINSENIKLRARGAPGGAKIVIVLRF